MKNLGTIALTVLTVLMLALLISGCGDDGVDGITGTAGCDFDQVRDADTGLCVHDDTNHTANHPTDGIDGIAGTSGVEVLSTNACAVDKVLETNTANNGNVTFKCVDAP